MSISAFTTEELSASSVGLHKTKLNAMITQANAADANTVDAVLTAADAPAGATTSAFTAQLNDAAGDPIAKAAIVKIVCADSEYGGSNDANANVTFGTATVGSILASGSGWAVIKTSATGAFACTATNASDEEVFFSAASVDGGVDAVAAGVALRGCVPVSATWAA